MRGLSSLSQGRKKLALLLVASLCLTTTLASTVAPKEPSVVEDAITTTTVETHEPETLSTLEEVAQEK